MNLKQNKKLVDEDLSNEYNVIGACYGMVYESVRKTRSAYVIIDNSKTKREKLTCMHIIQYT